MNYLSSFYPQKVEIICSGVCSVPACFGGNSWRIALLSFRCLVFPFSLHKYLIVKQTINMSLGTH